MMKPPGPFFWEVAAAAADADPDEVEVDRVLGEARALAEPDVVNRERVSAALRAALPTVSRTLSHTARPRGTPSAPVERGAWFEVVVPPAPLTALEPSFEPARGGAPLTVGPLAAPLEGRRPVPWLGGALLGGLLLGALGYWLLTAWG